MKEFFRQLFETGIYKRSQGRITRQVTFASSAAILALGLFRLYQLLEASIPLGLAMGIPVVLLLAGLWLCFRLVNVAVFADFLIAVEAEMNKVSWPGRSELIRASMVVLVTIFFLTVVLTMFDVVWSTMFKILRVV